MALNLPPIDESVAVPAAVKRASERSEQIHKAAYQGNAQPLPTGEAPAPEQAPQPENSPQPETTPPPQANTNPQPESAPPPQADTTVQSQPQPQPQPQPQQPAEANEWERRYRSMKGRFEQSQATIANLQENMAALGDQLSRAVSTPQPQEPVQPLLTDKDRETYGPDLIDFVTRAARAAVEPELQQVQSTNQHVLQRVETNSVERVYERLAEEVPNWQAINTSPAFMQWCNLPDLYSGEIRRNLLGKALRAANAPRVIAFFRGFLAENPAAGPQSQPPAAQPQAPRQPAVPLATLVAPGRPNPASGNQVQADAEKPIFTRAQVAWFYSHAGMQHYAGREAERKADEAALFAAQREGRVR